jgi:hypothetical protein
MAEGRQDLHEIRANLSDASEFSPRCASVLTFSVMAIPQAEPSQVPGSTTRQALSSFAGGRLPASGIAIA